MSFTRENIYRMRNIEGHQRGHHDPKIDICIEFFTGGHAPAIKVWVEKHYPHYYDHQSEEWVDAHTTEEGTTYVYGKNLLDQKNIPERVWTAYHVAEALANGSVSGKDASNLAWLVLHAWVIRAPKTTSAALAKAAPAWWERLQRG